MSEPGREQLYEYVFGELDAERRAEVERLVSRDGELRDQLEGLQRIAELLSDMPADAWPESAHKPAARLHLERHGRRSRLFTLDGWPRRLAAVGVATLLLAAGVGIGVAIEGGSARRASDRIALRALNGSAANRAFAETSAGRLTLDISHLPQLNRDHFYELWLMNNDTSLISLASFRVARDGAAMLQVPLPVQLTRFHFLDISVQSLDGGPEHSGDSVLRGTVGVPAS